MKLNKILNLLNKAVADKPEIGELDVKLPNNNELTYEDMVDFIVLDGGPSESFVIFSQVPMNNWCTEVIETTQCIVWNV